MNKFVLIRPNLDNNCKLSLTNLEVYAKLSQ